MQQGLQQFDKGEFAKARDLFSRAAESSRDPDLYAKATLNLGLTCMNVTEPVEALRYFEEYAQPLPGAKPDVVAKVKKNLIPAAWSQTGHIKVTAPNGTKIVAKRDSWSIERNAPLAGPLHVLPGKYKILFSQGDAREEMEVSADADKTAEIKWAGPKPKPEAAKPVVADVANTKTDRGFWTTRNTLAVGLGAGALASFGATAFFGLSANGDNDRGDELRGRIPPGACTNPAYPECPDLRASLESQRTNANLTNVFLVAGGVLSLGTVGVLLLMPNDSKEKKAKVSMAPAVSTGGAGVVIRSEF